MTEMGIVDLCLLCNFKALIMRIEFLMVFLWKQVKKMLIHAMSNVVGQLEGARLVIQTKLHFSRFTLEVNSTSIEFVDSYNSFYI